MGEMTVRIVSVGIRLVLLACLIGSVVLWARSYYFIDDLGFAWSQNTMAGISSIPGRVVVYRSYDNWQDAGFRLTSMGVEKIVALDQLTRSVFGPGYVSVLDRPIFGWHDNAVEATTGHRLAVKEVWFPHWLLALLLIAPWVPWTYRLLRRLLARRMAENRDKSN
jgi:hypothetical protein